MCKKKRQKSQVPVVVHCAAALIGEDLGDSLAIAILNSITVSGSPTCVRFSLNIIRRKKFNGDGSGEWSDHSTPQCQLAADEAVPEVLATVTAPRHWSSVVCCNSAPSGPQFTRDCKFECRLKEPIWSTCIRFSYNGDKPCDEFSVAILRRTKICNFNTFFSKLCQS